MLHGKPSIYAREFPHATAFLTQFPLVTNDTITTMTSHIARIAFLTLTAGAANAASLIYGTTSQEAGINSADPNLDFHELVQTPTSGQIGIIQFVNDGASTIDGLLTSSFSIGELKVSTRAYGGYADFSTQFTVDGPADFSLGGRIGSEGPAQASSLSYITLSIVGGAELFRQDMTLGVAETLFSFSGAFESGVNYQLTLVNGGTIPNSDQTVSLQISPVPEPASVASLAGLGLLAFGVWRRVRA